MPPQEAGGVCTSVPMLLVGEHPPLTLKPFNHMVYAAAIAASLLQGGIVTEAGQLVTKSGAAVTVNVELQVAISAHPPGALLAVRVNMYDPPHEAGGVSTRSPILLVGEHPPVTLKPFNQVVYAVAISAVLLQAGIVTEDGQFTTRGIGFINQV